MEYRKWGSGRVPLHVLALTLLFYAYHIIYHTYMIQKYVKERERFHSVVKTILELTV